MLDKEEIEKAKEYIVGLINLFYEFPNPQSVLLQDNEVQYIETLLQYIEHLEKRIDITETAYRMERKYDMRMVDEVKGRSVQLYNKIEKQEKIINEMAIQLTGLAIFDIEKNEPIILKSEEEVKKYFEEKVESENKWGGY